MGASPAAAKPSPLDPSFGKNGVVRTAFPNTSAFAYAVIVQPDRSIVVAGTARNPKSVLVLGKFKPNGSLDKKFGTGGIVKTGYGNGIFPSVLTRQHDGKIVVGATSFDLSNNSYPTLVRYRPNGSLDTGFGTGGIVRAPLAAGRSGNTVLVQRDGKVVIGTSADGIGLARYTADGKSLDTTFDGDGIAGVPGDAGGCGASSSAGAGSLVQAPTGEIVASGICNGRTAGNPETGGLLRYHGAVTPNDGALDTTFGTGGATLAPFPRPNFDKGLAQLADGRLLQVDQIGYSNVTGRIGVFRTTLDGAIDSTFGKNASANYTIKGFTHSDPVGLAVAPNGSLVIPANDGGSDGAFAVTRRTPRGAPDTRFAPGGQATLKLGNGLGATRFALDRDDRAVLVGTSSQNARGVFTVVRFRAPVDRITHLTITPTALVPASSGPLIAAATAHGAQVAYLGTEPATTAFTVQRSLAGRLQNGRCVAPTQANLGHKRCTRYVAIGGFKHRDRVASNQFHVTGRLHGHKLAPGNYRLRAVPNNSGGSGRPAFAAFRVKSG